MKNRIIKYVGIFVLFLSLSFALIACDQAIDSKDLEAVFHSLFENLDNFEVTEDLDFDNLVDGVSITYDSKNEDVIDDNGKVTRSVETKEAYVVVTLKYNSFTYTDVIIFKVLGTGDIDSYYKVILDYDDEEGEITYNYGLNLEEVKVGTLVSFNIKAKEGFVLDLVLINGLYVDSINPKDKEAKLEVNIDGDKTVLVRFKEDNPSSYEKDEKAVIFNVGEYATLNKWENNKCYNEVKIDDVILSMSEGTYSGVYIIGTDGNKLPDTWRMYQTEDTTLKIETKDDGNNEEINILSVKITFSTKDGGILLGEDGKTQYSSEEVIKVNGPSISFMVSSLTTTKGKILISELEVVYIFGKIEDSGDDNPGDNQDDNQDDKELETAIEEFEKYVQEYNFSSKETSLFDDEFDYENYYYFDGDYAKFVSHYCDYDEYDELVDAYQTFYLIYDEEGYLEAILLFNEEDNKYYRIDDEDEITDILYDSYFYMEDYPLELDAKNFVKKGDHYEPIDGKVNEVGKAFFKYDDENELGGDTSIEEVFTTFNLYLTDGKITKVTATSTLTFFGIPSTCDYILEFFDLGKTTLTLPDYENNENKEDNPGEGIGEEVGDIIVSLYGLKQGSKAEFNCYVNGFIDNLVYVEDDSNVICVYFNDSSFIPQGLEIGSKIYVKGTISYENEYCAVVVSNADDCKLYDTAPQEIYYDSISDLSEINDLYINYVIDLNCVKVSKIQASTTKNTNVVLLDLDGNSFNLYVSKNEVYSSLYNSLFASFTVNQYLDISNVVVAVRNNNLRLLITNQTNVKAVEGIILEDDTLYYLEGDDFNNCLDSIKIKEFSINGLIDVDNNTCIFDYSNVNLEESGRYEIKISKDNHEVFAIIYVTVKKIEEAVNYDILGDVSKEVLVNERSENVMPSLPSVGDVNILVIPIKFTNSSATYDLSKIEKGFNGTVQDTGWHSLKSYYETVSYGKLRFNANVLEPYESGFAYKATERSTLDKICAVNALKYYDEAIDYSLYDQNNDGKLDGVYFIYLAPYDVYGQSDLWWAYCDEQDGHADGLFDGLAFDWYMWASIEFFDEPIYTAYSNNKIDENKSLYVNINCETIIHETGHLLGLDDYYDYNMNSGVKGGLGSVNMMDSNQGDHDPFSKAILGWINPDVIVYSDYEKTLNSFASTGDVVIISKTGVGSYFNDELYIICYYTPTGVNEIKSSYETGIPNVNGFIIYHVDSTLIKESKLDNVYSLSIFDLFEYNNGGANRKLIDIILATLSNDIDTVDYYELCDDDLFKSGSSISSLKWYDGSSVGCTISFNDYTDNSGKLIIDFE